MHKRDTMGKAKRGANELRRHRKHMARLLTVGLGVVVGLSGSFVTFFTVTIMEAKLHFVAEVLEHHEGESGAQQAIMPRWST